MSKVVLATKNMEIIKITKKSQLNKSSC